LGGRGCAPNPDGGAYSAPQDLTVGVGGDSLSLPNNITGASALQASGYARSGRSLRPTPP